MNEKPDSISSERIKIYKQFALFRRKQEEEEMARRRESAWEKAKQAARLLKKSFGATRVVVFGSLAHGAWFNRRSDIDLAVEGIPPKFFLRAWCALDRLETHFQIDLVDIESVSERLRSEIDEKGVEL